MSGSVAHGLANKEVLRPLPLFAGLSEQDLDRLCQMARRLHVRAGDCIMQEGTVGDGLYIVVDGELEVSRRQNGADLVLAVRGAGEVLGEMALLEQAPRSASVRAVRDSELIVIDPHDFQTMLAANPDAARTLLRTVAARLRSTEAALMSREKLAALGTLAAGLAHELNNPAAAIRRSAQHLTDAVAEWQRRTRELGTLALTAAQAARLQELESDIAAASTAPGAAVASGLDEDALAEWLEARGVPRAWDAAPALAGRGWDATKIDARIAVFAASQQPLIVSWLAAALSMQQLLAELNGSAAAISEIVQSVKAYAYLDQAPVQQVDVRASLDSTLTMLRHRLKGGVRVVREYADDLPDIEAFGSELNQVWTNIIDNAVDAMSGAGTLTLRARRAPAERDAVLVQIVDTGAGIPAEIQSRIFDPFFTTKPPGRGSGLGLHIAHDIVVNHHRGRIRAESVPGRTVFEVVLPLRLRRAE